MRTPVSWLWPLSLLCACGAPADDGAPVDGPPASSAATEDDRALSEDTAVEAAVEAEDLPWVVYPGGAGPGAARQIVLVSGDEEYRSEEALPMLGRLLAERHGFRCTVLFAIDPETGEIDPDDQQHIPGLEHVDDADLVVLFTRFRELPDADMAHLVDYVERGGALIGIRTATHAFQYSRDTDGPYASWDWRSPEWPGGFGRQVLGETWVAHHGRHGSESTRGRPVAAQADHPVLRGVEDVWGPTDVYAVRDLPPDALVLVEGLVLDGMRPDATPVEDGRNAPPMPLVWVRERPAQDGLTGRVLTTTIGAAPDLASEDLRRLLVNACYWAQGLEDRLPAVVDARPVGPYEPTPFGFGGARKGVRPSDHAAP